MVQVFLKNKLKSNEVLDVMVRIMFIVSMISEGNFVIFENNFRQRTNEAFVVSVVLFLFVVFSDGSEGGDDNTVDHVHNEENNSDIENHISHPSDPVPVRAVRNRADDISDSSARSDAEVEVEDEAGKEAVANVLSSALTDNIYKYFYNNNLHLLKLD